MRVAIYARFSSDKQSPTSAADQVRACRTHADREGWSIVDVFADEALSGATRDRPALNALLLRAGDFDLVLAESIDRLSRDQEDIAAIHKRLRFAGVQIVTLADGIVGEIHIGLKGTMAALFLADLGQKTRRGQVGRVAAGRIPGGLSYGYRKTIAHDARGEPERGLREIDEDQAAIVRRIFAEILAGDSALAIARRLNAEGVPAPRGGEWRQNTILGNRQRRNGILNNELYAGRIVFNRQRMIRDPVSRRRVSRLNPPDQWVTAELEALRIVDAATFDAVQRRLQASAGKPAHAQRRPRRLFSGLLACGECGGPVAIVGDSRWGCSNRKEKGTCSNSRTIHNNALERRLIGALREQMLAPDIVQAYVSEYHRRRAQGEQASPLDRRRLQKRIAELDRVVQRIARAYAGGDVPLEELRAIAGPAEAERSDLRARLADVAAEQKVVELKPEIAARRYREAIERLGAALEAAAEQSPAWKEARAGLRALVDVVVVHPVPEGRGVDLELRGRLAELLALGTKKGLTPVKGSGLECTVALVAGARFGHCSTIATTWC